VFGVIATATTVAALASAVHSIKQYRQADDDLRHQNPPPQLS
jgi:hypothetical protein